MDDRELVERARAGDSSAFEVLVTKYQQRVYNLALRMTGNEEDAFDLSQEAFIKAWRGLETFQFDAQFSTWLYRLTSNACLDFLRAQKRRKTVSLTYEDDEGEETQIDVVDPAPDPEQAALASEDRELLRCALDALDDESREIITLRVIDDLRYDQIAEVLGVKEGTVKSRLSRAREKLKKKLLQIGNNPKDRTSVKTGKEDAQWSAARS